MRNKSGMVALSIGILPLILILGFTITSSHSVVDGYGNIMLFRSISSSKFILLYFISIIIFVLSLVNHFKK